MLVVVVEVVLLLFLTHEVALGELVDVHPVVAAQQVFHLVVVFGAVPAVEDACDEARIVAERAGDLCREVQVELVGVALLDHVVRAVSGAVGPFVDLAAVVGVVEPVPVDLTGVVARTPQLGDLGRIRELVVGHVVAGQVAVVVGTRVGTALPREGRVTVRTEAERGCCVDLRAVVGRVGVVDDHQRLVVVTHAGVAFLAVLITPVGIVVVVADQVVDLLCRSLLRAALGRSAEDRERQPVALVEAFLHRSVVAEAVVIDAVDPVVAALSRRYGEGIRPAVVEQTGGVGDHRTETVHRIAVDQAHAQALADLRGRGVDVGRPADAAQSVVGGLQTGGILLIARGVVQTAPQRPRRVARQGVVEADAVEIDVGVLRIVTAQVETHLAELVGGDVVEDVFRRGERRGQRLRVVGRLGVELREDRVVERLGIDGYQRDRTDVFRELVHANLDFERFVVVGFEREGVVARSHVVEPEPPLGVGGRLSFAGGEGDLHLLDGCAVAARDDFSLDAAALCEGRERRHRQKQCE